LLSASQREQVQFWEAHGALASSLWFFGIEDVVRFTAAVPREGYCGKSRSSRVYSIVEDPDSCAELKALLEGGPHPAWAQEDVKLGITLPGLLAHLVMQGKVVSFAVPSPFAPVPFNAPRWFRDNLHPGVLAWYEASLQGMPDSDGWACVESFHTESVEQLAQDLRRVILASPQHVGPLSAWVSRLQNCGNQIAAQQAFASRGRQHQDLIQYMLFSDLLRSTRHLHDAIVQACRLALPPSMSDEVIAGFLARRIGAPDKGQISRARMVLDCAMMMWTRCRNHASLIEALALDRLDPNVAGHARYLSWDSSEERAQECFYQDEERIRKEKQHMEFIAQGIEVRALPAVSVGFGSCSFAHKCRALFHGARLEHFSHASLALWARELVASMSDYGVERLLPKTKACRVSVVLPFFADAADADVASTVALAHPFAPQHAAVVPPAGDGEGADGAHGEAVFEDPDAPLEGHDQLREGVFEEPQLVPEAGVLVEACGDHAGEAAEAVFEEQAEEETLDLSSMLDTLALVARPSPGASGRK
jgi:hypothetical protein